MAVYPLTPVPSSIHAPAVIDPMHVFTTDAGVMFRRARYSRPRRRYQLDYLGKTTAEMRLVREFLQQQRLGALPFEWYHGTSFDTASYTNTTPVVLTFQHQYFTGQWVGISNSTPHLSLNGVWKLTRLSGTQFSLNGSTAGGAGVCTVVPYLPTAVGVFSEDTMEAPTKLLGPESVNSAQGRWSFSVFVEEVF